METESTKNTIIEPVSTLENGSKEKRQADGEPQAVNDNPIVEEDKEKNKELSEADVSDDEKTKRKDNYIDAADYADFWARRRELEERRKERDKQRRQHSRYMLNLDDRLNFLEEEVLRLAKAGGLKDPNEDKPPQPAIPEIKPMSWTEYEVEKGKEIRSVHYAIDMLIEEPLLFGGWSSANLSGRNPKTTATEVGKGSNADIIGPQIKTMPERIRINAKELCEALGKIADRGTLDVRADHPVIMRRPFKFLLMHEERIKSLFSQENEALQEPKNGDPGEEGSLAANEELSKSTEKVQREQLHNKVAAEDHGSSTKKEKDGAADADRLSKEILVKCLKLLISFIEEYVKPMKQRVSSQNRVSFDEVYSLFEPGQLVYVGKDNEQPQKVWRVIQVTGSNRFLRPYNPFDEEELLFRTARKDTHSPVTIDCYSLAFDGLHFRQVYKRFEIPCFTETQLVKSLLVIPYDMAKRLMTVPEDLMLYRSEQFLECTKISHRSYQGRTVDKDSQGRALKIKGESEEKRLYTEEMVGNVMIDMEKAFQRNPSWMPDFRELEEFKVNPREREPDHDPKREQIQGDLAIDTRRKEDYLEEEAKTGKSERWKMGEVDRSDMLLLPDRVPAYFLRARKWVFIQLGYEKDGDKRTEFLTKVMPKLEAWNDLQLPGDDKIDGHKNIIQSLVDKHFAKDMDLDLVRDKGRGLIVLLHGSPGVGKTSTAECVAEAEGKPLLPITCGDLGLQPEHVEANLGKHFELAQSWDCVLLLDEADVFLAERSLKDLNRNALVSVFLRILEYYEGILFLTTNKVGLIDEAFKSRIHMALFYPWLDEAQTQRIWSTFIRRAQEAQQNLEINEREILDFAREHLQKQVQSPYGQGPDKTAPGWNGRQIKNAFMSAIAIAQYEAKEKQLKSGATGPPQIVLTRAHFSTVARASEQFEEYLWKVHHLNSASKLAEKNKIRYDMYQPNVSGFGAESNMGHHASQIPQPYPGAVRPVTPAQQQLNYQMRVPHQSQALGQQYGQVMMQPQMASPQPLAPNMYAQGQLQPPMMHQPVPQQWAQSTQSYIPPQQSPQFPQQQQAQAQVQGTHAAAQPVGQGQQQFAPEQGREPLNATMGQQQQSFQQQSTFTAPGTMH